ncbi:MAG: hypothetical protein AAGG50_19405 [Bacteroidota bacterium]
MNGAVLEAAHLWGIDTLTRYDLRDAFVLGVSLAGKALVDCDFTGAVLKNVHTDGWQPDAQTLANTTYIYTDYEVVEEPDDDGTMRQVYRPLPESRVPADGTFGDADNPGFTLATYLSTPYRWNRALKFPRKLRQALLDYLNGFQHYAETIAGVEDLEVHPFKEGQKIRLQFEVREEAQRSEVEALFEEYVQHAFRPVDQLREAVAFRNPDLSEQEKAIFLADYEEQVASTQRKAVQRYRQIEAAEQSEVAVRLAKLTGRPEDAAAIQQALSGTLIINAPQYQITAGGGDANVQIAVQIQNYPVAANDLDDLDVLLDAVDELEAKQKEQVAEQIAALRAELQRREPDPNVVKRFFGGLYDRSKRITKTLLDQGKNIDSWAGAAKKIADIGKLLGVLGDTPVV